MAAGDGADGQGADTMGRAFKYLGLLGLVALAVAAPVGVAVLASLVLRGTDLVDEETAAAKSGSE